MVRYDYMCAVFPRGARKNRTPTEIKERSAGGKTADCVSRANYSIAIEQGSITA
jgi:hypothetical protein